MFTMTGEVVVPVSVLVRVVMPLFCRLVVPAAGHHLAVGKVVAVILQASVCLPVPRTAVLACSCISNRSVAPGQNS